MTKGKPSILTEGGGNGLDSGKAVLVGVAVGVGVSVDVAVGMGVSVGVGVAVAGSCAGPIVMPQLQASDIASSEPGSV